MLSKRFRRRKAHKKRRIIVRLIVLLITIVFIIRFFESQVSDFSKAYFPAFARQTTTKAVCGAVEKVLAEGDFSYDDLTDISYSDGTVSSVNTDPVKINLLKSRVVSAAEEEVEKIHNSVMHIPLGAFTKLSLIANCGPKVPLSFCLTGSFSAELVSTFESAGINQTIHHIKLIVTSKIVTASVDFKDTLTFSTDFEVAQSVLLGEIPTTYGGYYTPIR